MQFISPYDLATISSMFINDEPEPQTEKELGKELLADDIFNEIQQQKENQIKIKNCEFDTEENINEKEYNEHEEDDYKL